MYGPLRARLEGPGRPRPCPCGEPAAACEEVSVAVVLARPAEKPLPIGSRPLLQPDVARLAAIARLRGLNVAVETCTPYLFFTMDALDKLGPTRSAIRRSVPRRCADGCGGRCGPA